MNNTPEEIADWKYNSCERKTTYVDKDAAERAARRRRKATGLSINAYECRFSGAGKPHYHIGRKKKSAAQQAIRDERYVPMQLV